MDGQACVLQVIQQMSKCPTFDEINPWTFRHRSTIDTFYEHQSHRNIQNEALDEGLKLIPNKHLPHRPTKQVYNARVEILGRLERFQRYRIPTVSLEKSAFEHAQETLPLRFQSHFKPLKCKSNQTRFCFVSSPHREKPQPIDSSLKAENNERLISNRLTKLRRYYTEEKEQASGESQDCEIGSLSGLLSINALSSSTNRSQLPVKILRASRKRHTLEVITKGKSFDEVKAICQEKNIAGGGHLSQMKRTYNLKKLQRMINPSHP